MEDSFGARLRLQRERQQVPLATIADRTKIKMALLEGLERDDVSHWPAGIFRRSYIRAYAQAVGLEPDPVVREFLSRHPDPVEEDSAVEAVAKNVGGTTRRPPMRLTYLISSAIRALPRLAGAAPKPQIEAAADSAAADWSPKQFSIDAGALSHPTEPDRATFGALSPNESPGGGVGNDDEPELALALVQSEAHDAVAQPALFELSPPPPAPQPGNDAGTPAAAAGHDLALGGLADLCTRLGRAEHATAVRMVVEDATSMLGAIGLILWAWDHGGGALRPTVSHGYSDDMLAQVPALPPESDNAIASAFRSAETCLVDGNDLATGALAVPLIAPFGCVGVLAAEFRNGGERREWSRAILTILAAQLSMLVGPAPAIRAAASA
jgi:Helix-turn-helix domain